MKKDSRDKMDKLSNFGHIKKAAASYLHPLGLFSPQRRLASVFGMGTGMSAALSRR